MKIFQNRNFDLPAPSCIDDVVDDVVFVMENGPTYPKYYYFPISSKFWPSFSTKRRLYYSHTKLYRQHSNMSLQNFSSIFYRATHYSHPQLIFLCQKSTSFKGGN
ncbi:hypothetical protein PFMG_03937 [Plasmodium falciparum IGH-CR14]|uniref:Uncharacterized protein n=1 Tax=Plasmodium falciparum IGH-CR14 TaxID=580059 RepID=A0A0L1IDU2_PLAFA|nr:hypothetical protein PFMG_03937 [Plasmodium falciparum IGH-CR14]